MRTSAQTMMKASSRRFTTPTGRPVPAAHPLKEGSAPGYGKGGYQAPGPQKSGGGKVVPLVALLAVLGGAGAYYATMDDPKAAAARDARKLESGIKHEVNDFRQGARSSSAPLVDASSSRRELERAKDNVTPSKSWSDSLGLGGNSPSDEASRLGSKAQNAAEDAKDTVKGWGRSLKHETENAWNGHGEGVKDEIVRWKKALSSPDGKMGVEQVEEYLRSKGHYTTTLEPYRLFDFFGTAPSLRKTQVETSLGRYEREGEGFINSALNKASSEYERAKASMKSAGRDAESYGREAKNETKSWFNFGSNKAEREYDNAKADVKDTYYSAKSDAKDTYYSAKSDAKSTYYDAKAEVKDAANSVSRSVENATSEIADTADRTTRDAIGKLAAPLQRAGRRVEENVEGAADSARSTYYDAKDTLGRGVDQAGRAIDNTADDAARAARNAEQNVKAESKSWFNWSEKKAEDGKDAIKDGLLAAERKVEHGAQEAQRETRKL